MGIMGVLRLRIMRQDGVDDVFSFSLFFFGNKGMDIRMSTEQEPPIVYLCEDDPGPPPRKPMRFHSHP